MRLAIAAAISLALGAGSLTLAHADERTEAILLFDEGAKAMKAGKYAEACASFEKSNALYPDSGTKGSLARCYEKLGKLASSWVLWRELADTAPTADLRKDAAKQVARLDARVPKYVMKMSTRTLGLVLTVNGKPAALTDVPVPIDAGPVLVVATAPGYQEWRTELTAAEGAALTIEVPALVAIPKEDPAKPVVPPPPPVRDRGKSRRLLGLGVAGAGVVTVVVGGVFGVSAKGTFDDANDTCGGSVDACDPARVADAQAQVDDARSAANLSTILVGAGGALVVTGAVLYFTAPKAERRVTVAPLATPTTAGFVLSGRF